VTDDLLIRGGDVIDGSGAPPRRADVAVRDGRITAVGPQSAATARRVIDAGGHVVAPGFIDIKTHSDWTLPLNPRAESKVRQGVTTEVVGHCGFSVAPVLPGRVDALQEYLGPSAPWLPFRETTFAEYLDTFPRTAVNVVALVGHNTLRVMAMGLADRAPTSAELAVMRELLEAGLAAGAIGLSSGLFTAPGCWATSEEMQALAVPLRHHGAWYATHVRDESSKLFDSVREAIALAERGGIRVQLVHLKLSGTDNWGGAAKLLTEIEAARARGVTIDCDQYPYTAASNPLRNLLPQWVVQGGIGQMLERLAAADVRQRIRAEITERGLTSWGRIPSWQAVRVATAPHHDEWAGSTIAALAHGRGADPVDAVCDLLIEDRGATRVLIESMSEEDVRTLLRAPFVLVGSDGMAVAPYGVTSQGKPHPRFYGAFPRVLGHYVRELGLLPLAQAVFKMTGGPAAALQLRERGLLREGYRADITVFDPRAVAERSTYDDPHRYPAGLPWVIVNGELVIDAGEHTGALPGRVLRRGPGGVA
jgi:N-acyl-D-aspartate/D-glutamate deacylase